MDSWYYSKLHFSHSHTKHECLKQSLHTMDRRSTLCISIVILWLIGNRYLHIMLASAILALAIVLTFGFVGIQHTATGIIEYAYGNRVYIESPEVQPTNMDLFVEVDEDHAQRLFAQGDDITFSYRDVSFFSLIDISIVVDKVSSINAVGPGTSNVPASEAWGPITVGSIPLLLLVATILYRYHRHSRAIEYSHSYDIPEDDLSEQSMCISCGAIIRPGYARCSQCGWTYRYQD